MEDNRKKRRDKTERRVTDTFPLEGAWQAIGVEPRPCIWCLVAPELRGSSDFEIDGKWKESMQHR